MGLTILTDPAHPTRIGNTVTRDTCPHLTLTKNIRYADWLNTEETLGSDHCIVITITRTHPLTRPYHQAILPYWTEFRSAYSNSTPIAHRGYNTCRRFNFQRPRRRWTATSCISGRLGTALSADGADRNTTDSSKSA
ncbi:hypothetical protein HPB52_001746 [Rhipicephalus sanguineus]|uniref:Tick transposon n=1 Tax=Rhipicephalus sanguineus TaxID=34632 RepID=A0A9D4PBH8_RHISA|nr:hypothetical protein HPB52_001746 [Rhipicephalus sanguineus]